MSLELRGIIPPLATPFTSEGELDEEALRAEIGHLLDRGVHGLTVCGSTGEGHTLSVEETVRISEIAVEESRGRVPVVTGIIRDSTREVIRYGEAVREAGVDGLQVTPVHYLFSPGEEGTYAYYEAIGGAVGLPIVIYNVVPWNTVSPELLLRLSEIPQVAAVKQSGGDIHKLADLLRANRGRLRVLTAVDDLLYPSFMLGADGAVAAILTVLPELCVRLWDACRRGDHPEARAARAAPAGLARDEPSGPARAAEGGPRAARPAGRAGAPSVAAGVGGGPRRARGGARPGGGAAGARGDRPSRRRVTARAPTARIRLAVER
jgi:4-hydroxy-tetrahydrodipicolinate synthase